MKFRRSKVFLPLLAAFLILSCRSREPARTAENPEPSVIFPDGFAVNVTIARTDNEKALGLMYVANLPDDRGMLFLNEAESRNPFWMKNCLIPLDLVWLDMDGKIVDISRNVPPCKEDPCPNYFPAAPYFKVLEVRGNLCAEHGVSPGDKLVLIGAGAGS